MRLPLRVLLLCAAWLAALVVGAGRVEAADTVRAVKAASVAWTFTVLDVGMEKGLFAKYGITVDISSAAGDAKVQQALASGSVDFGLGSGPSMAFTVKGSPVIAVAAFAGPPRNIGIIVAADAPFKTIKDLKGKSIAVTTTGSLTEWLVKQASIQEGLGPDGIKPVALGTFEASFAALEAHDVDGIAAAIESGYRLEEKHKGRVLAGLEKYAPHFITHVVLARKDLVRDKPDVVERFLKGFFATIAYMKTHKAETDEIGMRVLDLSQTAMDRTYDYEISMFIDDGQFDPQAVETLKDSFVGMGTLTERPKNDQLFTTRFVPVKP
jgi:ABC-type nitrate/sulfonate/bicarbonate transport system substrate-binding protein